MTGRGFNSFMKQRLALPYGDYLIHEFLCSVIAHRILPIISFFKPASDNGAVRGCQEFVYITAVKAAAYEYGKRSGFFAF